MSTWRLLSPASRTLLLAVLLTGVTTFMFLPLLAIELIAQGLRPGVVGLLVGLLAFSSQGFSLLTGFLVDRFGPRAVTAMGFTLRIAGYVLLGLGGADRPAPLVAGIVGVGIGGSLLGLAIKTQLVAVGDVAPRTMLALRSTFVNIGVIAGPALGAVVYPLGFRYILAACVLSHLVIGAQLLRRSHEAAPRRTLAGTAVPYNKEQGAVVWNRWRWAVLIVLSMFYWVVYSQLTTVVPIVATTMTGSTAAISAVFVINGLTVVAFQYALLRHLLHRTASRTLLVVGFLAFACAYAALLPQAGWASLLVFVLPLALAEMLISPSLDEQAVQATSLRRTGLALGAMSAAGAVGSLLGSSGGGLLLEALQGGSGTWLVIMGVSVAAALGGLLLPRMRAVYV